MLENYFPEPEFFLGINFHILPDRDRDKMALDSRHHIYVFMGHGVYLRVQVRKLLGKFDEVLRPGYAPCRTGPEVRVLFVE
jgi:hypothetical protein